MTEINQEGKLVPGPDPNAAALKAATTRVASAINKEMAELQKKFPGYYFELSFERQPLPKQTFYRIHLKTFKNE